MKHTALFLFIAVLLVAACGPTHEERLAQLEQLEQWNRADSVMRYDSLALLLTDYFDSHGSSNERLRAHYILGRTYADLGEAPAALEEYMKAADCADTISPDCDYRTLSRVHAQSALIYNEYVQPACQIEELSLAERYAWMASDTLIAIECHSQKADAYDLMKKHDSVIVVKETSAEWYREYGREDLAAMTIGPAITSAIEIHDLNRARNYIHTYEMYSGLFDKFGNIESGREIYYYIKGQYYLALGMLDSAEHMFRREQSDGWKVNDKIASSKGLQEVFELRGYKDSLAKYASLSYELNDSAYLLSEMENIQRFRMSYNYNRNKMLAEKNRAEAIRAHSQILLLIVVTISIFLLSLAAFIYYSKKKKEQLRLYRLKLESLEKAQTDVMELNTLDASVLPAAMIDKKIREIEEFQKSIADIKSSLRINQNSQSRRLEDTSIVKQLRNCVSANPPKNASAVELKELRMLINDTIPNFYSTLNHSVILRPVEYDICVLVKAGFYPAEIAKLMNLSDSHVANIRRRLHKKVYGYDGSPTVFDRLIREVE